MGLASEQCVQSEIDADLEQAMRADEVILVETATPSETLAAVERVLAASGASARRSAISGL